METSIISNFIWNNIWTFKDPEKPYEKTLTERFISFQIISVCALTLYTILLYIFTDVLNIYYIYSSLLTIPITVTWNYLANSYITWRG